MIRALKVLPRRSYPAAVDTVTLDHDSRFRRRIALTGAKGTAFLLDLPEAVAMRDGDGVELEDGRVVMVKAAGEDLTQRRDEADEDAHEAAEFFESEELAPSEDEEGAEEASADEDAAKE
mgnify:CR=1 FL=1